MLGIVELSEILIGFSVCGTSVIILIFQKALKEISVGKVCSRHSFSYQPSTTHNGCITNESIMNASIGYEFPDLVFRYFKTTNGKVRGCVWFLLGFATCPNSIDFLAFFFWQVRCWIHESDVLIPEGCSQTSSYFVSPGHNSFQAKSCINEELHQDNTTVIALRTLLYNRIQYNCV